MLNLDYSSLILPPLLHFYFSCLRQHGVVEREPFEGPWAFNTLTPKKAVALLLSQNSLAQTSSLALSLVLVERCWKLSPLRSWSASSTATQGQTSASNSASRSLILFCLMMGNVPFGQLNAWSMLKVMPQTQ